MRILGFLLAGALAVILAPTSGLTQNGPPGGGGGPPGGFGGGGFRPPDPSQTWERMAGGKDSITRADVADQRMQFVFDMTVRSQGITNGVLTKQQFMDASQKFMQQMAAGGGMRGFGGGGGRQRGQGRGQMGPGGMPGGMPAMGPGGPNVLPGGGDPTEAMFRKMDQNGDGLLNSDEMPADLRASLAQWDANKDGMIDLNEFKEYMKSKAQPGQGVPTWVQEETPEEEEKRPVTYHADNLPKDMLPNGRASWFSDLDKDHDAQIGLYEWKDSGRPLEEFLRMDRNGDGYLTVEEVLYYLAAQDKATAKLKGGSKNVASAGGPGGPRGFGGPSRPGGGMPGGPPDAAETSPGSSPSPVQAFQAPGTGGDQNPRGPRSGGGGQRRRGGGGGGNGQGRNGQGRQ